MENRDENREDLSDPPDGIYLEPTSATWETLLASEPCGGYVPLVSWLPTTRERGPYRPVVSLTRPFHILQTSALVLRHEGQVSSIGTTRAVDTLVPYVEDERLVPVGLTARQSLVDLPIEDLAELGERLGAWNVIYAESNAVRVAL